MHCARLHSLTVISRNSNLRPLPSVTVPASHTVELSRKCRLCSKKHGVYNLSRLRESMTRRYKDFHIPTDWMLDTGYMSQTYIDFEISEGEFGRTIELYERLLDRTKHLKVWISYAKFEVSAMEDNGDLD